MLDANYWQTRYEQADIPWDMGMVSPPLRRFLDTIPHKAAQILLPGAGSAYEAIYLHQHGYTNVWVCDWAANAFDKLQQSAPDFPEEHKLIADYFELDLQVDFIIEQTFFCALEPSLRQAYAQKSASLLKPDGILAGLLFAVQFEKAGPPFGGSAEEYASVFSPYFEMEEMDICPDSIAPRAGRELWIRFKKK